jgi:hypothetical protein
MFILIGLFVALLLIASFVGWGRLVSFTLFGSPTGDWPFQAAWGICLLTVIGGLLNALGCVSATVNTAILVAGIGFLFFPRVPRRGSQWRHLFRSGKRADLVAFACLAVASAIAIVLSLFPLIWEPLDDAISYASFPRKMLETGRLIEPFSFRRIVGFGGYQYLQTLAYPFLSHGALHFFDRGIATSLVAAALACFARRWLALSWPLASLAGLAFLAHPLLRVNLAPASIFSLLPLSLLESFELTSERPAMPTVKRAAILALLIAGLLSLRANALAIAGSLVLILVLSERNTSSEIFSSLRAKLRLLAQVAILSGLLLLPWSLALYQSSGTLFFPLFKGNYNAAISMSVPLDGVSYLRLLASSSMHSGLHILALLLLVGLAFRAMPRGVVCFCVATMLTWLAIVSAFNLADLQALHRYYSPFTSVAFILVVAAWLAFLLPRLSQSRTWISVCHSWSQITPHLEKRTVRWSAGLAVGLAVTGSLFGLLAKATGGIDWHRQRDWRTLSLERSLEGRAARSYVAALAYADGYQAALAKIPKGARVLAEVDAPFLLDYRHHDILLIDDIAVVSPPPRFPINGGSEKLAGYLRGQAIDYIMYVKPTLPWRESMSGGYNRHWWESMKETKDPNCRLRAPNYEWFFGALEGIAERYQCLHDSSDAVVVSLKQRQDQL